MSSDLCSPPVIEPQIISGLSPYGGSFDSPQKVVVLGRDMTNNQDSQIMS